MRTFAIEAELLGRSSAGGLLRITGGESEVEFTIVTRDGDEENRAYVRVRLEEFARVARAILAAGPRP